MPRGGPRYKGRKPPDLPNKPGPPKPKPSPKPKYRGKKPKKPKKVIKREDDLLKIAEEEYGDSKYAGDIARANPQIRNFVPGAVINLPTVEEEVPEIPELTTIRGRRPRVRFGAPGRRQQPEVNLQGGGPAFPAPPGVPTTRPVPQYGPPAPAPESRFLEPGYAGTRTPSQTGQPTQAAEIIQGTQAGPYTAPGPGGTALLQYNPEGRPFAVIDEEGNVAYGTSIVPYLLEQGVAPLMITPYDVNVTGLDENLLVEYGYTQDDWGNWVRPALEPAAPSAGGGGGGGGYGGGYYYPGYGGGGRGVGGGGRPASYSGRQILDYLGLGQVSWRI